MRPGYWFAFLACLLLVLTPSPVALAANTWCDADPLVVIKTPAGNYVPVYVTVGAANAAYTPDTLMSMAQISYSAVPTKKGDGTQISVTVTVPQYLANSAFDTRVRVSSGPWATLYLYSQAYGLSGQQMTSSFTVPYP